MLYLYHGGHIYWRRNPEYPEKTTDPPQVTVHVLYKVQLTMGDNFNVVIDWLYLTDVTRAIGDTD